MLLIPYHTQRTLKRRPVATYVLIALNVVSFLLTLAVVLPSHKLEVWSALGVVPGDLRLYTLLTYQFLHEVPIPLHLLSNMLFLYTFGPPVEDILGCVKFVLFYLLAGVCSALTHLLIVYRFLQEELDLPLIGASGAVAGVMGFAALRLYRTKISIWYFFWFTLLYIRTGVVEVAAAWALGAWGLWELVQAFISLAAGSSGGVAHWGHIGGFALGLLWALALKIKAPEVDEYTCEDAIGAARQGRWAEARRKLRKVVDQQPENAEAILWLARALAHTHFPESAARHFARAVRLFLEADQIDASFAAYQELVNLQPDYSLPPNVEMPLGTALTQAGQYARALQVFHRVATRQPDTPEGETALLRAGQIYLEKLSQPQEAWKIFRAFRHRYPSSDWKEQALQWERQAAAQLPHPPNLPGNRDGF